MSDHNDALKFAWEKDLLEKLSVLSFSGPQSISKVKSKHPVALNEKKKPQLE